MPSLDDFHDVRLPERWSFNADGGPGFLTSITVNTKSGKEHRNIEWSQERWQWNISKGIEDQDDFEALIAFFRARKGRAFAFALKNWFEYTIGLDISSPAPVLGTPQLIGTGDGTTATFQIFKEIGDAVNTVQKDIVLPVLATVRVFVNDIEESTSNYSVSRPGGLITFTGGNEPGNTLSVKVACEFDYPVRFENDNPSFNLAAFRLYNWPDIFVVEVKPDP